MQYQFLVLVVLVLIVLVVCVRVVQTRPQKGYRTRPYSQHSWKSTSTGSTSTGMRIPQYQYTYTHTSSTTSICICTVEPQSRRAIVHTIVLHSTSMCSSVCVLPYVTIGTSNSTSGTTMVHSTTLHLLYLYYSTINICTINGTSGTTNSIDRSSNSHFLVNIYYTFIKNVPTLLASHDSSPICWRTVGTVPNVAYVL